MAQRGVGFFLCRESRTRSCPGKQGTVGETVLPAPNRLLLLLLTQLYREFIFINTLKPSGEEARVDVLPGSLPREGICFLAGAGKAALPPATLVPCPGILSQIFA